MTPQHITAVRKVREEADKLRLACIAAAGNSSLMHIAFDRRMVDDLPVRHAALLGHLNNVK